MLLVAGLLKPDYSATTDPTLDFKLTNDFNLPNDSFECPAD